MPANQNSVSFAFGYGLMPDEINEFVPRLFVVEGVTDANGVYNLDISEYLNRNLIGNIQSVIISILDAVTPTRLELIYGVTGARVSACADAARESGYTVMPFLSPQDCAQHVITSSRAETRFQLVFTNVPLPLLNSSPIISDLPGLPAHYLSAASTNPTVIKAAPGTLLSITAINTTATLYYLKMHNTAAAPTAGVTPVALNFAIPASASGNGFVCTVPTLFTAGIAFTLVGGIADADNSNAATGITLDFVYR